MSIFDKWFKSNKTLESESIKQNNQNIETFANLNKDSDEILSNSVLVQDVYKGTHKSQFDTIKGYSTAVYGGLSSDKVQRLNFYREMALYPDVSDAIDEICDSCINNDENGNIVNINFTKMSEKLDSEVITEITTQADYFLSLWDFENNGYDYYRRLVVDGEITWENIIDSKEEDLGIIGINYIRPETYEYLVDSNYIHKGILINAKLLECIGDVGGSEIPDFNTRSVYNKWNNNYNGFSAGANYCQRNENRDLIVLPMEQITHANSGNFNHNNTIVEPVLERARRPYRQLSLLEDATIIYRLVRAPERLVFNVDVGKMPQHRAEEHVYKMMKNYNTGKVYDPKTGGLANGYDPHSMLESFWFPKPQDAGGTEVDSIGGNVSFGELEDLKYFQRKLFVSLKIPYNRFDPEDSEEKTDGESITYEEYRFSKFIIRIQQRMSKALNDSFKTHLQLMGLWEEKKLNTRMFNIEFVKPTAYDLYNSQRRLNIKLDNYGAVAGYDELSKTKAMRQYLGWSEEEIEDNRKLVETERMNEAYLERKLDNIADHGYPEDEKDEDEMAMGMM